jgi:UDPglucose 6-dehydrogenase
MPIVQSAIDVNYRQRLRVVGKLQEHLKVLRGTTIGLLGLAFKANTDDLRDAPAITLAQHLLERGAVVRAHDPIAMPHAKRAVPRPRDHLRTTTSWRWRAAATRSWS